MTSASLLGMAIFSTFAAIMAKRNRASQFILALNIKKQLQKVNKTVSKTEHIQIAAKL
jgi:hypothetical protein